MIKGFGIENWRVFRDRTNLELKDLTILTGTNSSGKSSFHKSILTLKGALRKDGTLSTELNRIDTGFFANNISRDSESNEVKFIISSNIPYFHSNYKLFTIEYTVSKEFGGMGLHSERATSAIFDDQNNVLDYTNLFYTCKNLYEPIISLFEKISIMLNGDFESNLKEFNILFKQENKKVLRNYSLSLSNDEKQIISTQKFLKDLFIETISLYKENISFPETIINQNASLYSTKVNFSYEMLIKKTYAHIKDHLNESIEIINSIEFIPSLRTVLSYQDYTPTNDYLAQIILRSSKVTINKPPNPLDFKNWSKEAYANLVMEYNIESSNADNGFYFFVLKWLKEFEIGDDFIIEQSTPRTLNLIIIKEGIRTSVADMGYGHSQVLPIIFALAIFSTENIGYFQVHPEINTPKQYYKPHIVIIDEPETNLHPRLQSKLADLFIETTQNHNAQLIIETHSEYLIRRLQYLIGTKKYKAENAIIHYFYHPNTIPKGAEQVYPIKFQESGILSKPFGEGFYDEGSRLSLNLFSLNYGQNN